MRRILSSQILIFYLILKSSLLFAEDCIVLNPNDYGDCNTPLGYIWSGNNCIYISGCSMLNNEDYFYDSYEECSLTCFNNSSLGDINDDAFINVIDVINLVNIILNNQEYLNSGDLNFDGNLDIVDVVSLVNLILVESPENRDTWTIISNDILTPKCAQCHYEGSFYAETSNLILTNDIAYSQLINRQPYNNSALNNGLDLLSDDGSGCRLGDERPVFCKMYPLEPNNTGRIVVGNWSYLHCPKPKDYELDRIEDGKYHYKLIKPHKNKRDELILEDEIENVVKQIWLQSKEALIDTYGEEFYERIKIEMKQTIKHEFF